MSTKLDKETAEEEVEAIATWLQTDEGFKAADTILCFAQFIKQKSLPQPWDGVIVKAYRPFILSRCDGRRYIILLNSEWESCALTVPKALVEDGFDDLSRLWLLDPVKSERGTRYHLRGRQRVFGLSIADLLHAGPPGLMRIYGPRVT
jgi:hypothetical protein